MTIEVLFVKENQAEYDAIFASKTVVDSDDEDSDSAQQSDDKIIEKNMTTSNPVNLEENLISRRVKDLVSQIVDLKFLPRAMLRINIQVLQDCGNLLSNTLNCVVLALLDTGVDMITTPIAVQNLPIIINDENTEIPAKKVKKEKDTNEKTEQYLIIFDQANNYQSVLATYLEGDFDSEKLETVKEEALIAINGNGLRSLYQDALRLKLNFN